MPARIRGTVESLRGDTLTVRTAKASVAITLPPKTAVVSVIPADRGRIKDGAFLGIASVPGPKGAQVARDVVVFPESARGTGEGSYPWDLPGGKTSKMTNGTVHALPSRMTNGTASLGGGETLTLRYKSSKGTGSQTIRLAPGIPVVTFEPGTMAELKKGAHVIVFAHAGPNRTTLADRVLVGKNGLVPPM